MIRILFFSPCFNLKEFNFKDLAIDVTSIINYFKDDKRFSEIILFGHSQGSLVAMLAINSHVTKYISLAGLGESVDKTIIRQISAQNAVLGDIAKKHIEELKNTGTIKEINPFLLSLFAKQNHDFLISYIQFNPAEEIKKITIPTLIINGNKDIQVLVSDAESLHKANPTSKLVLIENMNHVLKHINKEEDNLKSYTTPDFPLSEQLVNSIVTFVKQ